MRRLCALLALLAALAAPPASPAGAGDGDASLVRYEGADRYETAARLALARFATSSDILLARGDDPADGFTAAYPAGGHSAPVLLTRPDRVPAVVLDAMEQLGAFNVHLMGGHGAISLAVEQALQAAGYHVDRYAGRDRYETAAIAAESNGIGNAGRHDVPVRTAMLAAGDRPTDALVTAPLAWAAWPLLLTERTRVPAATIGVLERWSVGHIVLIGGTDAIDPAVEAQIRAQGRTVERVAGATGEETALRFAELLDQAGYRGDHIGAASGSAHADALALGVHVAPTGPLVLCGRERCGDATTAWVAERSERIDRVIVAGGTGVVSDAAAEQLRAAAG